MMNRPKVFAVVLLLAVFFHPPGAIALDIPPSLQPWETWVLHGMESQTCPSHFNDGTRRHCWWPSRLLIDASDTGGLFEQQVTVYAPTWVRLPGGERYWPETVSAQSDMLPVIAHKGTPAVWLMPGEYRINGVFVWDELPEMLQVPPSVGLLSLRIDNREPAFVDPDKAGRLRLHGDGTEAVNQDRLSVSLFRRIEDDIPMRVETRMVLHVSGRPRDIRLASVLPAQSAVMAIDSPLSVQRVEATDLLVQVRPGRWDVRVTSRLTGPVETLSIGSGEYGDEIWSFRAYNHLRMVKVTGAPAVEPSRTQMPDEWKGLPAYRIKPGGGLSFDEIRRGDPDPAPDQLHLERTWWLDFDGGGFTLHDRLSGHLNRTWHLAMTAPVKLGRVAVDGMDRLITRQGDRPGVQLRSGRVAMQADSRLVRQSSVLPAVGWDHDFQRVTGTLNLPPGWGLFATAGVDEPPDAWLQRWTLLDLFLVLIIAISAWKLRSRRMGLLVLVTLVLIFHEPGAPRHIWLHLLVAAALFKYLPAGWLRKVAGLWGIGAVVALVVISVPFMVQQIRTAVYPQLESGHAGAVPRMTRHAPRTVVDEAAAPEASRAGGAPMKRSAMKMAQPMAMQPAAPPGLGSTPGLLDNDPDAPIQTGPGLPAWQWRRVPLRWNGPVDRGQQIRLWLIPPFFNLILGVARTVLLFMLIAVAVDVRRWPGLLPTSATAMAVAILVPTWMLLSPGVCRSEPGISAFPPQALLDELQQRLLEPPACLPACADVSRLELAATPDQLRLVMQIHALSDTAIPLPVLRGDWTPTKVMVDNTPARSLLRDDGGMLWMVAPQGVHQLKLTGPPGEADEIRFAFPMRPHTSTYAGVGWRVNGIHADGSIDTGIVLTRIHDGAAPRRPAPEADMPPFFHLSRILRLGIRWQVFTRIRRQTDPGTPAVLSVPLLDGEAVTTPGVHVESGQAQVAMGPDEMETQFASTLPVTAAIRLEAPSNVPWSESWMLDASPIWSCTVTGLTVIHHQDAGRRWKPQWRPWPGESVTIAVTRPEAVPGQTITVDRVRLELTPGRRLSRSVLDMAVRTGSGGAHQIELPAMANLQAVKVDGQNLPIRQDGRLVNIPLEPGSRQVRIQWQELTASLMHIRAPAADIGHAAVNAEVSLGMPDQRWILLVGGPTLGPAVLFWSYLLVAALIAWGLGRTDVTPLRTRHWLLLALGLTQVPPPVGVLVAGWLIAVGYRCRRKMPDHALAFNLVQLVLVTVTLAALAGLYTAIENGLLGIPDMQIAGNHSTRLQLNWTQDRIDGMLPTPWVISLPLWTYRLLMLAWSLWLAFSLVAWLRWAWGCFSRERLWKPIRLRRRPRPTPTGPDGTHSAAEPSSGSG